MAKRRGQGRLKGGIGYPGAKEVAAHNLPVAVARLLRKEEKRLGVSKSALVVFAVRKAGLYRYSLQDIEQDIRLSASAIDEERTESRRKRWKATLAN